MSRKKPGTTAASRAKKKSSAKSGAKKSAAAKTGAAAKTPARKSAASKTTKRATAKPRAPKKPTFSSIDASLLQVFSLRPRVNAAFRPEDFRTAKHRLREERFGSREAALRAVVDLAHDLGRGERPSFADTKSS